MSNGQVHFDGNNPELLRNLMKEYGHYKIPLFGTNDCGEDIEVHIAKDSIIYKTYQSNGWLRVNHYDANGYPAGETFEGRWNK